MYSTQRVLFRTVPHLATLVIVPELCEKGAKIGDKSYEKGAKIHLFSLTQNTEANDCLNGGTTTKNNKREQTGIVTLLPYVT